MWRMVDPQGREYGTIEIRRVNNGAEIRYRCTFAVRSSDGRAPCARARTESTRLSSPHTAPEAGRSPAHWGEFGRDSN